VLHDGRGWPLSVVSAAVSGHFLLSAAIVMRLPALHRRFGIVAATRGGAFAAGLGALGWALAGEPWHLVPATLRSGAGWATLSGAAINAMAASWFDRRRPAAISKASNGASVGGVLLTPLWTVMIAEYGFATAASVSAGRLRSWSGGSPAATSGSRRA